MDLNIIVLIYMDFFTIVQWGTVCGVWGVVWVIGWAMGVGVGGVNSFRPIYKGNPLENFFDQYFSQKKKLRFFFTAKNFQFFFQKIYQKTS